MKTKKGIIILLLLFIHQYSILSQTSKKDLIGYWQSQDDTTNYYGFSQKLAIPFSIYPKGKIVDSYCTYGFYNNLKLQRLDSLKEEGIFYFEIDPDYFDENERNIDGTYQGIWVKVIQMDDDKNRFQIYDPARPGQRGTYKRIKQLPPQLAAILKSKGIVINPPKQDVKTTLSIKSQKARIYTEPNKPSKMFLVKGDTITVLQEKDNWLYILYVTSKGKEIKGWVKKEDVSSN